MARQQARWVTAALFLWLFLPLMQSQRSQGALIAWYGRTTLGGSWLSLMTVLLTGPLQLPTV